ncbi:hypothetical protein C7459_1182 [Tumebacillus permanentifrigoris]|uniref:Uncharacterized protein n=1 Tax=Tumebacillus permanentifrigoris TaxID=378543 RepID=A0A316D5U9_9BACL|nr:hypothetical protein C7459_1182 [Tumebacillus permanentifrigoris]
MKQLKTFAILINGKEQFRVEAIGQFTAVMLGAVDERYRRLVRRFPRSCFLPTAVEVVA